jgi:carbonic anhydrase
LLDKIKPSVAKVSTGVSERSSSNPEFVNNVAKVNVYNSVQQIMENSELIRDLIDKGEVGIVPAMYDVATGVVTFYEQEARIKELAEHQNQYNSFAS